MPRQTNIITPHEIELCYGSPIHCHWHNVDESQTESYRICFECNHTYATSDDLITAWVKQWESWNETIIVIDPNTIPSCAFCTHDW